LTVSFARQSFLQEGKVESRRDSQKKERSARKEWKRYKEVMAATGQDEAQKRAARGLVPPLVIGFLGIGAAVALYFLRGGFQSVELVLMFIVVAFGTLGYTQRIVRGVVALFFLYVATGLAATLYVTTAPYIGAPFSAQVTRGTLALSFIVLMAVFWIALEFISRRFFKDMGLTALGLLDNLGGLFVYFVIGVLVAALLFNALGYSHKWQRAHDQALLRQGFNQVVYLCYTSQSFWFPQTPPPIYVYDLSLPGEP
jgi:uncharacterized membrane protein required for colicin V production